MGCGGIGHAGRGGIINFLSPICGGMGEEGGISSETGVGVIKILVTQMKVNVTDPTT